MARKLTFEQVDRHVQKADLKRVRSMKRGARPRTAAMAMDPRICAAYAVVKPILQLVVSLPFVPQKWKAAITLFMQVLDSLCG